MRQGGGSAAAFYLNQAVTEPESGARRAQQGDVSSPARAGSTPLQISRYPQSCPLEITHLGASTTHTGEERFPGAWVGASAFSSAENPDFTHLSPSPIEPGPPLGSEALSWPLHPLLVLAHHHSALAKLFLLPPPCNSWPKFLILASKA